MRTFWTIIIVAIIIGGIILINKNQKVDNQVNLLENSTTLTGTGDNTLDTEIPTNSESEVAFTVRGGNFIFNPNIIKVKEGETVTITFINEEGFHDLKIDEYDVATKQIEANKQEIVTFVANKKGSFEYYCSVGTHRQMGMKGTLIVE